MIWEKKKKNTGGVREDSNLANRDLEFLIPQSDDSRWGMDHSEDFFFVCLKCLCEEMFERNNTKPDMIHKFSMTGFWTVE